MPAAAYFWRDEENDLTEFNGCLRFSEKVGRRFQLEWGSDSIKWGTEFSQNGALRNFKPGVPF